MGHNMMFYDIKMGCCYKMINILEMLYSIESVYDAALS
jgi:hypothetical protein